MDNQMRAIAWTKDELKNARQAIYLCKKHKNTSGLASAQKRRDMLEAKELRLQKALAATIRARRGKPLGAVKWHKARKLAGL